MSPWRTHGHSTHNTITHPWAAPWGCPFLGTSLPRGHTVSWQSYLLQRPRAPHMGPRWQGVRGQSRVPLSPQSTFGRSRRSAWGRTHGTSSATPRMLASLTSPCASSSSMGWTSGCGRSAWPVRGLPPRSPGHPWALTPSSASHLPHPNLTTLLFLLQLSARRTSTCG